MEGLEISFTIVGSIALLFGVGIALWRISILVGWKARRAVVTGYSRTRAYRGSSFVKLSVRYAREDGAPVEAVDHGAWDRYVEGQELTVLEAPGSDPPRIVVHEVLRFWMMPMIFLPFGGVFLYVALVYVPGL